MKTNSSKNAMKEVFTVCQNSSASHGKLLKELTKLYQQDTLDNFTNNFTNFLTHALVIGDKQPAVDRTLDFCVKFATSIGSGRPDDESIHSDDTNPFLIELFEFLLKHSCAASQAVRFRVCQMTQKLLNALSDEATIDDELFTRIYDCMLERLRDKVAGIRVQAVFALQRLQEPGNKECPVIRAYIHHLHKDPNVDVRRAVLMNIASSVVTLSHILDRCKDISDSVRKQAYILVADKISVRSLSISQREKLLKMGLKDRSPAVREVVEKRLLTTWLSRAQSHIGLLRMLDVESSADTVDLALQTMFKSKSPKELLVELPLGEERLVPKDQLSSNIVLYWKSLAKYFQSSGLDDDLEKILPELTAFVNYVKSYILEPTPVINDSQLGDATIALHYEFVSNQLIAMLDVFDKSDESGRRHLLKTIRDLLLHDDVTPRIARPLVRCYSTLENNPETRTTTLLEIIADIREPLVHMEPTPEEQQLSRENELKVARLKVRLNILQDEFETAVKDQLFVEAQRLKDEIEGVKQEMEKLLEIPQSMLASQPCREERRDPQTYSKCLEIISELLQSPQIKKLSPGIRSLFDNFILSCVAHEDPEVRHAAMKDIGICCLLDKNVAQNHCLLLTEAAQVDPFDAIRMTAVKTLFDLVSQYGLELFAPRDEEEVDLVPSLTNRKSAPDVSTFLIGLLENESMEMQTLATEGLCKLLLIGRIQSSALLSRLLLQWYHPLTAGDEARHILGVFFSAFPAISKANQELFVGAFRPTLKTIINAPVHSPIAVIDLGEIVKKFVLFTSDYILMNGASEGDSNVHDSLSLAFCQEILRDPDIPHVKILIKLLNSLQPALPNRVFVDDLRTLVKRILEVTKDRVLFKLVEKFDSRLEARQETFITPEDQVSTPIQQNTVDRQLSGETSETFESSASIRRRQLMSLHQRVFGEEEEIEEASQTDQRELINGVLRPTTSDVDIPSECDLSMDEVLTDGIPVQESSDDRVPVREAPENAVPSEETPLTESDLESDVVIGDDGSHSPNLVESSSEEVGQQGRDEVPSDFLSQTDLDSEVANEELVQRSTRKKIVETRVDLTARKRNTRQTTAKKKVEPKAAEPSSKSAKMPKSSANSTRKVRRELVPSGGSSSEAAMTEELGLKAARVVVTRLPETAVSEVRAATEPRKTRRAIAVNERTKRNRARIVSPESTPTSSPSYSTRNRLSGIHPLPASPAEPAQATKAKPVPAPRLSLRPSSSTPGKGRMLEETFTPSPVNKRQDTIWSDEESRPAARRSYVGRLSASSSKGTVEKVTSRLSRVSTRASTSSTTLKEKPQREVELESVTVDSPGGLNSSSSSVVTSSPGTVQKMKAGLASHANRIAENPRVRTRSSPRFSVLRSTAALTNGKGPSPKASAVERPTAAVAVRERLLSRRPRSGTSSESSPEVRKNLVASATRLGGKRGEPVRKSPRLQSPKMIPPARTRKQTSSDQLFASPSSRSTEDEIIPNSPGASERSFVPGSSLKMSFLSRVPRKK